jgi:hypothetical protein
VEPEGTTAAVAPAAVVPAAAVVAPVVPTPSPVSAPVVPETYSLSLPEKSLMDPAAVGRISGVAKALKLPTNEAAQVVLQAADAEVRETLKVMEAANAPGGTLYVARTAEMSAAALKHPELGNGDPQRLKDSQLRGQLLLNRFGKELVPLLEHSGEGSRPELLLLLTRLSAAVGEKALVMPGPDTKGPVRTEAQRMYPELYPELSGST